MPSLQQISDFLQPIRVLGRTEFSSVTVEQLNIENTKPNVLMWVSKANSNMVIGIQCGIILCCPIEESNLSKKCTYLFVENPRGAFQELLSQFYYVPKFLGISQTAKIEPSVIIGEKVSIGHYVVIESGVKIGEGTSVGHNTVIASGVEIGCNVKIGANCVIGEHGFGFEKDKTGIYQRIPHIGNVIICDNVEIGQCTTIDRAVLGSTHIGANSKIDNNVQIGHGVRIGKNTLVIANTVIGGSTEIGNDVWISPGVSIINKVTVGDKAIVGIGSVIVKSVEPLLTVFGNPSRIINK